MSAEFDPSTKGFTVLETGIYLIGNAEIKLVKGQKVLSLSSELHCKSIQFIENAVKIDGIFYDKLETNGFKVCVGEKPSEIKRKDITHGVDWDKARKLRNNYHTQKEIAEYFGVGHWIICKGFRIRGIK